MAGEIQKYTEEIIELLGLEQGAYPDENMTYRLDLSDDFVVRYSDLHPGVYMFSNLAPLHETNKEVWAVSLMHLNLFGNGTGGGVIGYDAEEKQLTLSQAVPYKLRFDEFKNALEDFINYVDFWKMELKKAHNGESSILTSMN